MSDTTTEHPLASVYTDLEALRGTVYEFDDGSTTPIRDASIDDAREWITTFYKEIVAAGLAWHHPRTKHDGDGDIEFLWMEGEKSLDASICTPSGPEDTPREQFFLCRPWPQKTNEDGSAHTPENRLRYWRWFLDKDTKEGPS